MAFQTACFIMALRLSSTARRLRRSGVLRKAARKCRFNNRPTVRIQKGRLKNRLWLFRRPASLSALCLSSIARRLRRSGVCGNSLGIAARSSRGRSDYACAVGQRSFHNRAHLPSGLLSAWRFSTRRQVYASPCASGCLPSRYTAGISFAVGQATLRAFRAVRQP